MTEPSATRAPATAAASARADGRVPWYVYAVLLQPAAVQRGLERVREAGVVPETPNLWQVSLGVLRMWYRVVFRFDTIGTCRDRRVRPTLRARLLQYRPLRFPFLLAERAVAPFDFSGLASPPERILSHLVGAHHDRNQFAYDLELLSVYPGWLERVREAAAAVVASDGPRARWLRDLTVFEGYHEDLVDAVERAIEGRLRLDPDEADDPDISFLAYLRWCARQPATPAETFAAALRGELSFEAGPVAREERTAKSEGREEPRAHEAST